MFEGRNKNETKFTTVEKKGSDALEMAKKTYEKREAQANEEVKMTDPLPKELYDILACPMCKGDISYNKDKTALVCKKCKIDYPIKDGIPIMLPPDLR